jgi:hypothetical protein
MVSSMQEVMRLVSGLAKRDGGSVSPLQIFEMTLPKNKFSGAGEIGAGI